MTINHYKQLFRYNFWANDRVWNCIQSLSDEQFVRPCDYSIGSIHEQIVHQMSAEAMWLERAKGNSPAGLGKPPDYPTREVIAQAWKQTEQDWYDFLDTLTDDLTLEANLTFRSITTGKSATCLRWEALSQILNHSTDHRAQILSLIHQVGGATLAQDYIFYAWDM